MKKRAIAVKIGIGILLLSVLFFIKPAIGEDKMDDVWGPFSKWYEWKKATKVTDAQKAVINYFDQASEIRNKAQHSNLSSLLPDEAANIISDGLKQLKSLRVPRVCSAYHKDLIEELKLSLKYQNMKKAGGTDKDLNKLTFKILSIDGKKFTAFFNAIEQTGLFENMDEELSRLQ